MFSFSEYPFVRLTIWLIAGILLAPFIPIKWAVFLLIFFIILFFYAERTNKFNSTPGFLVCLTAVILFHCQNTKYSSNSIYHFKNSSVFLIGRVDGETINKTNNQEIILKNLYVLDKELLIKTSGKILVNYYSVQPIELIHGDVVALKATLKEIPLPMFDNLFNYREFLNNKHIYLSCKVKEGELKKINEGKISARKMAILLKRKIVHLFNLFLDNEVSSLAIALITGDDINVSSNLIEAFRNTGTLHILAVSGMHVGLIFWILNFLFNPLKKNRKYQVFFNIITLLVIWLFCMVAGLSDSVVRAGTMISFVIIGFMLNKKTNLLNHIFAAAFCMLAYNINVLYNTGFQLSCMAIAGIYMFYKPFSRLINTNYKVINKLWDLIAVSLAAQLGTGVLSVFYFNQFPNWFLLSNLLLVPISSLIIYGCIILLIVSPFKWLCIKTGYLVSFIIKGFVKVLLLINKLPYLISAPITISFTEALILLALVLVIYWVINFKNYYLIKYALLHLGLYLLIHAINFYKNLHESNYFVIQQNQRIAFIQKNGADLNVIYNYNTLLNQLLVKQLNEYAFKKGINSVNFFDINKNYKHKYFFINNQTYINEKGYFTFNRKIISKTSLAKVFAYSKRLKTYAVMAYHLTNNQKLKIAPLKLTEIK